jgi:outer membrane protein assembly factor BamB
MTSIFYSLLFLALLAPLAVRAQTNPWPQFLGPTRDAVYHGADLAEQWPKEGPRLLWQAPAGEGFSGPVVAEGKLILFHRLDANEVVECLDWLSGKSLWTFVYPTKFKDGIHQDNGPRSTPAIADGRVFTYGAEGELHCLDLQTGKKVWHVSGKRDFGVTPRWHGVAGSPLIEGNALLLNIGNTNDAGIVAFDKSTGAVLWQGTKHKASCSSPVAASVDGKRYVYFLTSRSFAALDPATGRELFAYPLDARHKDHLLAASPVVHSNLVFASGAYNVGGHLLRVQNGKKEKLWSTPELATQYATAICYDDCIYGVHGQWESGVELRCVDLKTGELRWQRGDYRESTLLRAGDQLLLLTYTGLLVRAPASPKEFKETARAQVAPFGVRAYPALADGLLYVRARNKLLCLDMRKSKGTPP